MEGERGGNLDHLASPYVRELGKWPYVELRTDPMQVAFAEPQVVDAKQFPIGSTGGFRHLRGVGLGAAGQGLRSAS